MGVNGISIKPNKSNRFLLLTQQRHLPVSLQIGLIAHQNRAARPQHLAVAQIVQYLLGHLERAAIHHRIDDDEVIDVVRGQEGLGL